MPSKLQKSSSKKIRNLKLTLEYDGSRFFGFQRQPRKPTIQAALEEALSKLFNRRMKITAAAGRTDAGVHAAGQVVNFKVDSTLSPEKIRAGLNALLPREIAVKQVEEVAPGFHARYGARSKTYEYHVLNSRVRSPLLNGRVYHYRHPLDLRLMRKAAGELLGRRDFKSFQAAGSSAKNSVRHVRRFAIMQSKDLVSFTVEADGFLYHMVRNLVGTLLEVGRGNLALSGLQTLTKKRDRALAGPTVPPQGLTLVSVSYKDAGKVAKSRRF